MKTLNLIVPSSLILCLFGCKSRDFAKVDAAGRQEATDQEAPQLIHSNFGELKSFIQERFPGGAYLFVGHGSAGQFKDTDKALADLSKITSTISARSKGQKWVAVYGGDDAIQVNPILDS